MRKGKNRSTKQTDKAGGSSPSTIQNGLDPSAFTVSPTPKFVTIVHLVKLWSNQEKIIAESTLYIVCMSLFP